MRELQMQRSTCFFLGCRYAFMIQLSTICKEILLRYKFQVGWDSYAKLQFLYVFQRIPMIWNQANKVSSLFISNNISRSTRVAGAGGVLITLEAN
jgi:hypothetical protein